MLLRNLIKKAIRRFVSREQPLDAAQAYDLWARSYDSQSDNLLIYLDDQVFAAMNEGISYEGKVIADIGCGTGRHWGNLFSKKPSRLIGYDVSKKMLRILRQKFPQAETHVLKGNSLQALPDGSCDIIISNLVIGYIEDLGEAFAEWNRVLKHNGVVMITELHPEALQKGSGVRSFSHDERTLQIKNYIHPLQKIGTLATALQWEALSYIERRVDESIRPFYLAQDAPHLYERLYEDAANVAILYGWRFRKASGSSLPISPFHSPAATSHLFYLL
jgi:ubiquinone/menaquinone biosynthesis C-methylase UbiE